MMIQSSNPLFRSSGMESGGASQPGLLPEGGDIKAFTTSLMQQLALLQGNQAQNANLDAKILADLQAKAGAIDGCLAGQEEQNFAALFGNVLPTAKKIDQNINLDDTLKALADVLQHLQDIGADAANPAMSQPATDGLGQALDVKNHPVDSKSQPEQALDLAALAAAVSASMQQTQNVQQPPQPEVASNEAPSLAAVADDASLLVSKKAGISGNAGVNHGAFAAVQGSNDNQPVALDGETAGAFLNQDNTSGSNAGQGKNASSDNVGEGLTSVGDKLKGIESDKNPSRMASDIALLNQVVKAERTVEVPPMTRPITQPGWDQELGQKLIWMHKQDIPSAELRINPEHLGPISIKVDVNQDQTTVSFTAHHAGVKEAIEAALPKLREMLSEQQLNLADVNVSQQQSEQRQQPSDFFKMASERGNGGKGQNDEAENPAIQATADIVDEIESGRALASNGVLSLFA
ncbi:MAG: flagellar hook-length control protein FliK [Methylomonas sp.]